MLWEWPKHDLNANTQPKLWAQIDSILAFRGEAGQVIAVDWRQKGNIAYDQVTECCHAQNNGKYPTFNQRMIRNQRDAWEFLEICAN